MGDELAMPPTASAPSPPAAAPCSGPRVGCDNADSALQIPGWAAPSPPAAISAGLPPAAEVLRVLADLVRGVDPQAPEPRMQPELLTRRQAAELLAISISELAKLESTAALPEPVSLGTGGRCIRYARAELRAWVARGCPMRERWRAMRETAMRRVG